LRPRPCRRTWRTGTSQPDSPPPTRATRLKALRCLAFSPGGQTRATGERDGVVKLWDVTARTERATLVQCEDEVTAVAFNPDGRPLAVAVDRAAQLWEVATGPLVANLTGHEGNVPCPALAPTANT
jgi:WD40 repeat protein